MLKALIRFSLQYSSLVILASLLLSGYAAYRLPQMSVDVFPELNAPTVVVMTEAGGLAADEVEQYVTFPIESAVNGMTGVRRVRSASAIGLSIVWGLYGYVKHRRCRFKCNLQRCGCCLERCFCFCA